MVTQNFSSFYTKPDWQMWLHNWNIYKGKFPGTVFLKDMEECIFTQGRNVLYFRVYGNITLSGIDNLIWRWYKNDVILYEPSCVKYLVGSCYMGTVSLAWCSVTTSRRGGRGEVQEGGDICVLVADSHCCMPEANTIL